MIDGDLKDDTLQYPVTGRHGAAKVYMQPASEGTGVIAGARCARCSKWPACTTCWPSAIGSTNPINVVRATFKGLEAMRSPEDVRCQARQDRRRDHWLSAVAQ